MGFFDGLKAGMGLSQDLPPAASARKSFDTQIGGYGGTSVSLDLFGASGGGSLQRGSKELLAAYRSNPHLRKVVSLIANQLAASEYFLVKANGNKRKSVKAIGNPSREDIVTEHPFLDFWYRGNPVMPGVSGHKLSWTYYLLKGEFFWLLLPDYEGAPSWLPIPPTWVKETPGLGGGNYKVQFGNRSMSVPAEAMFWVRDPDVLDPFGRGVGAGDSLRDEIDTDEYASVLMRTTLANKGLMDGILSAEGASPESLRALRLEHERNHRGTAQSGRMMVTDGAVKYQPLSHAFSELKLLELRAAEKAFIEEAFCVPPELFGKVSGSNRATIYEATNIFARNVLVPNLTVMSLTANNMLLPLFDPKGTLSLWFDSPVPADLEMRSKLIQLSPQSFTANEIRELADLPRKPWGDVRYVQAAQLEIPAPEAGNGRRKAIEDGHGSKKKP